MKSSHTVPWAALTALAFLAGFATGLLFVFALTEPML